MTLPTQGGRECTREPWETEVLAQHRWTTHGEEAAEEQLVQLRKLWGAARPLDAPLGRLLEQIVALEICNWNLTESLLALCTAIGCGAAAEMPIGHMASVSKERWRAVWAYYLAARQWLAPEGVSGCGALLQECDPDGSLLDRVATLLGERDLLKELYVERFCLMLEFWIGGLHRQDVARAAAHRSAVSAVEAEITRLGPEPQILDAMKGDGDGRLQPCNHKAFRRYDVILSSIGAGKWRAVMPMRGTDGIERASLLEKYLSPIESWLNAPVGLGESTAGELDAKIHSLLGEPDDAKIFLASLLLSLLRSQQLSARKRAEARIEDLQS